jgi:hypothetical protein
MDSKCELTYDLWSNIIDLGFRERKLVAMALGFRSMDDVVLLLRSHCERRLNADLMITQGS